MWGTRDRAAALYSVGSGDPQPLMQCCASAAKLRGGGPILDRGIEAKVKHGTPPPRTVIGDPPQAWRTGPKLSEVSFSEWASAFSAPDAGRRPRAPRRRGRGARAR